MSTKTAIEALVRVRTEFDTERDKALDNKLYMTGYSKAMEDSITRINKMIKAVVDEAHAEEQRNKKAAEDRAKARSKKKRAAKKS